MSIFEAEYLQVDRLYVARPTTQFMLQTDCSDKSIFAFCWGFGNVLLSFFENNEAFDGGITCYKHVYI